MHPPYFEHAGSDFEGLECPEALLQCDISICRSGLQRDARDKHVTRDKSKRGIVGKRTRTNDEVPSPIHDHLQQHLLDARIALQADLKPTDSTSSPHRGSTRSKVKNTLISWRRVGPMPSQDRRNCDANMGRVEGRISLRGAAMSCDLLADGRQVICGDIRHHIQDVCLLAGCELES